MKHLDLFSGIGGFALATEMVWDNVEHIFCDNDPFAQAVLSKHWPQAYIHGDIRTITNSQGKQAHSAEPEGLHPEPSLQGGEPVYLLTGGFPCQPFSQAGARRGTEDSRHLWPEMLRVIREFHPRWVVGENVGGLVTWSEGLVLEQIHTDLESEGYEVQAFIIPAVSVGAPHRRDRVWIVAHSKRSGFGTGSDTSEGNKTDSKHGSEDRQHRKQSGVGAGEADNDAPDPRSVPEGDKDGRGVSKTRARTPRHSEGSRDWETNWLEVATRLCRMDDGVPRRLDRNPRLKALGNAIVPQVAAEIFKVIKEIDK